MPNLPEKLQNKLSAREARGVFRSLPEASDLVDFSSNDYLGFSRDAEIAKKTMELLSKSGIYHNGATGSRLLSGNHTLYAELEEKLTRFYQVEAALVFNSGYDANTGFFGCVPQRGDVVFYDEYVHASIRDGIKMGNAKSYKFKHNDLESLKEKIELSVRAQSRTLDTTVYIATESVFSMDGDSPELKALAEFCTGNNYNLIVDEAHAIGVFGKQGRGLVQKLGIQDQVFARIITFGKAMGCHGAAILGSTTLKDYLVNFARSFIYTTGLPPHSVATIMATYDVAVSSSGVEKQLRLASIIDYFNAELETGDLKPFFTPSSSAIHCCIVEGNERVTSVAKKIQQKGFDVRAIKSPTVPEGKERLRFCLHGFNTKKEIDAVLKILTDYL